MAILIYCFGVLVNYWRADGSIPQLKVRTSEAWSSSHSYQEEYTIATETDIDTPTWFYFRIPKMSVTDSYYILFIECRSGSARIAKITTRFID